MNARSAKTLVQRNLGLWAVAALLYPIAHWIPTASGQPPRIFDILVPLLVFAMGIASTTLLRTALGSRSAEPADPPR